MYPSYSFSSDGPYYIRVHITREKLPAKRNEKGDGKRVCFENGTTCYEVV